MNEAQNLIEARKLLGDPRRWAKGAYAFHQIKVAGVTVGRFEVGPEKEEATCWCVRGAVRAVTPQPFKSECYLVAALTEVTQAGPKQALGLKDVALFNDAPHRTHGEVLNLLDVAIRLAEAEEAS